MEILRYISLFLCNCPASADKCRLNCILRGHILCFAVQAGEHIASLELDDPSAVRKAEPFSGGFPVLVPPTTVSGKVHQRFAASSNAAQMILACYEHNIDEVDIQKIIHCLWAC